MCEQINAIHFTYQLLPKACQAQMCHFQEIKSNEFSKLIFHVHEQCSWVNEVIVSVWESLSTLHAKFHSTILSYTCPSVKTFNRSVLRAWKSVHNSFEECPKGNVDFADWNGFFGGYFTDSFSWLVWPAFPRPLDSIVDCQEDEQSDCKLVMYCALIFQTHFNFSYLTIK